MMRARAMVAARRARERARTATFAISPLSPALQQLARLLRPRHIDIMMSWRLLYQTIHISGRCRSTRRRKARGLDAYPTRFHDVENDGRSP